ncbi:hypothetical protein KSP40_PGU003144 [Platanthera guangdongensis]|uniref:Uncharacterized protein n=1 Tax=Platanthera guangdongensis TaxID=2320717 RepID=A0ABR2LDH9_9ASPA
MLAITPLINCTPGERAGDESASNLLVADDISADFNFDLSELFAGFDDGEVLPGLDVDFPSPDTVEVEPKILERGDGVRNDAARVVEEEEEETVSIVHEEVLSCDMMQDESVGSPTIHLFPIPPRSRFQPTESKIMSSEVYSSAPEGQRGRKPSLWPGKCSVGKRKMKVRALKRQLDS